ncbi:hypothetical protein J41TS2_17920 [Bacillus sonorensis]|uniref:hypothetical protein n=1 Tax=Bacillus sonorensis TaxID=119858 RepID=UPI001B182A38|nr:hypothetical protein [Bacillus sonorensis]GIN66371.1 hypothetical protein J41TS2_17920 [Bacillus sonorensis]
MSRIIKSAFPKKAMMKNQIKQNKKNKDKKGEIEKSIQEKIKENMANKNFDSNEEIDQEENDVKYKELYKDAKKNLKNAEKEIQKKSKETSRLNLETKAKDKEISKLKQAIHEMSSEYDGLVRKFKELEKEKANIESSLKNEICKLELKIKELNKILEHRNIVEERNEKRYKNLENRYEKLKQKHENFKKIETTHKDIIEKMKQSLTRKKYAIKNLKTELNERLTEIDDLQEMMRKNKEAAEGISPEFMLQTFIDSVDRSNFHRYELAFELTRKIKQMRQINAISRKNESQEEMYYENRLFGNVFSDEKGCKFIDINGIEYNVDNDDYLRYKYKNGSSVSAVPVSDSTVKIVYTYKEEFKKEFVREAEVSHSTNKSKVDRSIYHYIGDFSVLIVSSRNGLKYRDRLRLHGLKANWIEGFEKEKRAKELMEKADVVILCIDSVSHAFSDFAKDQNDPKYQLIYNHNEDKVVSRVIYAKHELGLG